MLPHKDHIVKVLGIEEAEVFQSRFLSTCIVLTTPGSASAILDDVEEAQSQDALQHKLDELLPNDLKNRAFNLHGETSIVIIASARGSLFGFLIKPLHSSVRLSRESPTNISNLDRVERIERDIPDPFAQVTGGKYRVRSRKTRARKTRARKTRSRKSRKQRK